MRRGVRLCAALAVAPLAACSPTDSGFGSVHDVADYRGHPAQRAAELTACRGDPGRRAATLNCADALAADGEAVSRTFWTASKPAPRVAGPGKL